MHQYSAVEGMATDWHLVNAGRYAQGGASLVIMESTKVARNGCGTVGDAGWRGRRFSLRWPAAPPSSRRTAPLPASSSVTPAARRASAALGRAARC